jgi:RNA polymerase sigma-70 factor (ECF subfamily)
MTMHKVDTGVIESCRQGDREALRVIFEAYKDKVYSLALCYLNGDVAAAKDLTQEVFIKLITRLEQVSRRTPNSPPGSTVWLPMPVSTNAVNVRRWFSLEDSVEVGHMVVRKSLETLQLQKEMADGVKSAVAQLKPKLRIAILLKYFDDLSYQEIASVLGCSVGTVASRLNRGHRVLARKLAHLRNSMNAGD